MIGHIYEAKACGKYNGTDDCQVIQLACVLKVQTLAFHTLA